MHFLLCFNCILVCFYPLFSKFLFFCNALRCILPHFSAIPYTKNSACFFVDCTGTHCNGANVGIEINVIYCPCVLDAGEKKKKKHWAAYGVNQP